MGDQLEDENYLREDLDPEEEVDWEVEEGDDDEDEDGENDEGDSDVDDDDDDNDDDDDKKGQNNEQDLAKRKAEKKLKQKQKLKELKEKKRKRLEEEQNGENDKALQLPQLSESEMLSILNTNSPDGFHQSLNFGNEYSTSNFFYPALDPKQVTESLTKIPCPFVRALSVSLPNYKKILYETPKNRDDYGAPILLIVCASATRATEVIKSISSKLIKLKIGKLFAKHFKILDQIELLSKEYYSIVIGTPNRLRKLIEIGALQLSRLQVVLLDYTNDQKNYNLITLSEVKNDFYELLYGPIHKERNHLKIALIRDVSRLGSDEEDGHAAGNGGNGEGKKGHPKKNTQKRKFKGGKNNNTFRQGFNKKSKPNNDNSENK